MTKIITDHSGTWIEDGAGNRTPYSPPAPEAADAEDESDGDSWDDWSKGDLQDYCDSNDIEWRKSWVRAKLIAAIEGAEDD